MDLKEEERVSKLKSMIDELCDRIRSQKLSSKQAQLEAEEIKKKAEQLIPDDMDKFDLIYKSRFQRLIQQFLKNE